jgi:outer membrane protein
MKKLITSQAGIVLMFFTALATPMVNAEDLLSLYKSAMQDNPTLKIRELGIERAKADADIAVSRLYPQVNLQVSSSKNYANEAGRLSDYYGQRANLSARQAILDLASYYRFDSARYAAKQAESEAQLARMQLTAQLIDSYLEGLQSDDEMEQLWGEKEVATQQVARLLAMFQMQMAKVTDLSEATAYLQQLETRQIDVANKADAARIKLRELSGRDPGELAVLTRSNFPVVPYDENYWVRSALDGNPDILARTEAVKVSRSTLSSARAEHYPQLSFLMQRNESNQDIDNLPRREFGVNVVGLDLRIPIYEGGRVNATMTSALAQLNIAQQQLEATRRTVERDMRLVFASAVANHARIESTTNQVNVMEQSVTAQEVGFDLGVVTVIDVLDARRRLFKARLDLAKARYDFLRDLMGLRMRSGALRVTDIEEFNQWLAQR